MLQDNFAVKDIGELSFFLGIEAVQSDHGLYLSQRRYILDPLIRSKMDKAKPYVTPMSTSQPLIKSAGIPFHDPHLYRSVVGGLQYLSFTQPDLAYALIKLASICKIQWSHIGQLSNAYCII